MVIPFRAKDVAADKTEFGHPDVALVLAQLSYYYSGLKDEHLFQITGFSGTNDTQLLLPIHICQHDLSELQTTNAIVIHYLLQSENKHYEALLNNADANQILNEIVHYKLTINVILDVGALLSDGTNRDIAMKWLNLSDIDKIDYAVYLESDLIVVCDHEIHTRGTDFKFPTGFIAAVTLSNGLTKDRLVQACMRMRKLGKSHSLVFWSSYEVHQQISTLKDKTTPRISQVDILRWVYENKQRTIWDGLHYWATQSLSYQRRSVAFQHIHWVDNKQEFTDTLMQKLARDSLEAEIIELKQMYGASKMPQLPQAVIERLHALGGTKTRLAHLLNEEQERELEEEEERQLIRPPSFSPCEPVLHPEIEQLCHVNENMMDLTRYPNVFRSLTYAFTGTTFLQDCQVNSWQENVWVSTEFQRVIETKAEPLNPFLCPLRWLIVYRNRHVVFISLCEANWLLARLYSNARRKEVRNSANSTTLRLLLPRTKRIQSIFINTPTLTIPALIASIDDDAPFFQILIEWLVQFFIFNGTLYFETVNEQTAYCQCLALCPRPYTDRENTAFKRSWIAEDGFVSQLEHRHWLNIIGARFQLIENRNKSYASFTTHVESIIFNAQKLLAS
ncbi:unnamed protein product [Rotaria sp. Silwood2]|nr:unnamed protein product [Rotaria sp. Silwood2]CAF3088386.1 unnamed protein product [Rotaria sp. Silwood2]CAF3359394.1 unnamed protein product [Rotaria sp. Silwood2]CAF3432188.1 unnamed protein product [Rotaria sp. Silwood2]CAF4366449.1 unnamed protein product [Rotaria sp. Silwood2]